MVVAQYVQRVLLLCALTLVLLLFSPQLQEQRQTATIITHPSFRIQHPASQGFSAAKVLTAVTAFVLLLAASLAAGIGGLVLAAALPYRGANKGLALTRVHIRRLEGVDSKQRASPYVTLLLSNFGVCLAWLGVGGALAELGRGPGELPSWLLAIVAVMSSLNLGAGLLLTTKSGVACEWALPAYSENDTGLTCVMKSFYYQYCKRVKPAIPKPSRALPAKQCAGRRRLLPRSAPPAKASRSPAAPATAACAKLNANPVGAQPEVRITIDPQLELQGLELTPPRADLARSRTWDVGTTRELDAINNTTSAAVSAPPPLAPLTVQEVGAAAHSNSLSYLRKWGLRDPPSAQLRADVDELLNGTVAGLLEQDSARGYFRNHGRTLSWP